MSPPRIPTRVAALVLAALPAALLAACAPADGGLQQAASPAIEADPPQPWQRGTPPRVTLTVGERALQEDCQRLALNVGKNDPFGAAQLLKNRLINPGYEAGIFSSIWLVDEGADAQQVPMANWTTLATNDETRIGWPETFWNGGEFEILDGASRGRRGRVQDFRHENDKNHFQLEGGGLPLEVDEVVATRVHVPGVFREGNFPVAEADPTRRRPGTLGRQSLRLMQGTPGISSWNHALDTIWGTGFRSAGKLMQVQGDWRFSVWARGAEEGAKLRVRFRRSAQEATFLDQTLTLSTDWQRFELDFFVAAGEDPVGPYSPSEAHPSLFLEYLVPQATDEVWIDDAFLGLANETNPTAFTDAYVARLRELRPSVLRHLARQFGGDLDNQLARPEARQTTGYSPARRVAQYYDYSLHEFLELCHEVGADPWYCIPTSWFEDDYRGLMEYLAAPATPAYPYAILRALLGRERPWTDAFGKIHLEYGNESWGSSASDDPFFGISVGGPRPLARIADERFALLRQSPHFEAEDFDLVIGGLYVVPSAQRIIDENSDNHDSIALAPYFGRMVDDFATDEELYLPVFARVFDDVALGGGMRIVDKILEDVGKGTRLAIYELNFHSTRPSPIPLARRNELVTGVAGALALPLYQLVYMREFGMGPLCAFTSLEYSFEMTHNQNNVRLWGLLRDLEATGRKRPTWLGLELANAAILDEMVETSLSGPVPSWTQQPSNGVTRPTEVQEVQAFAFRKSDQHALILFNLSLTDPIEVELDLPREPIGGGRRLRLMSPDLYGDNEDSEQVWIERTRLPQLRDGHVTTLEPHSVQVFRWKMLQALEARSIDR